MKNYKPKKNLTEKQKQAYIKSGYGCCPKCKSTNIKGEMFEADGNQVWQPMRCDDCGLNYNDIYTLTGVEVL